MSHCSSPDSVESNVPPPPQPPCSSSHLAPALPPRLARKRGSSKLNSGSDEPAPPACSAPDRRPSNEDQLQSTSAPPHQTILVSVSSPQLCRLCQDYIITPRCTAHQCTRCHCLFHSACFTALTANPQLVPCCIPADDLPPPVCLIPIDPDTPLNDGSSGPRAAVSSIEQPLAEWNRFQVAHWLTVIGLSRFVMLFLRRRIDGNTLLKLVPYSEQLDQVVDPFSRQALRRAIMALAGLQPEPGSTTPGYPESLIMELSLSSSLPDEPHDLVIMTFLREVACVTCKLPLLGLSRQGYQCRSCGIILHRICRTIRRMPSCSRTLPSITEDAKSICPGEVGTLDYNHLPSCLLPYRSSYFGVPLVEQPMDSSSPIPRFLMDCITIIEQASNRGSLVDLGSVYQQSASTLTLHELHEQHAHTLPSEACSDDVVRLTQLLKAFLRDLPNPVVPEDNYLKFCRLSDLSSGYTVQQFLADLPEPHRLSLLRLIKHVHQVWARQQPDSNGNTNRPRKSSPLTLLLVFRQILIRPPWHLLPDLTTSLDVHLKALQLLFRTINNSAGDHVIHRPPLPQVLVLGRSSPSISSPLTARGSSEYLTQTDNGMINLSVGKTPEWDPKEPMVDTPPTATSLTENKRDLATREWYWGDITQAEVREIMDGLADGHFLVRVASGTSDASYTLAIRHRGENKLIRIFHRGDYFDVVDPPSPRFRLVSDLIEYYKTHSVFDGKTLPLRPISRMHFRFRTTSVGQTSIASTRESQSSLSPSEAGVFACYLPEEQLNTELGRISQEVADCEGRLKELASNADLTTRNKDEASKLSQGYRKVKQWLELQCVRLNDHSVKANGQSGELLARQLRTAKEKLTEVDLQITEQNQQFALFSDQYRAIVQEQVDLSSRVRKLKRLAQEVKRALKDRTVFSDDGNSCFPASHNDTKAHTNSEAALSEAIADRSMWFIPDLPREKAEALLQNKPVGTFLIRSATGGQRLALSVSLLTSVQHCLIHQVDHRFGFVQHACTFETLEELVAFYHLNSLKQHNPALATTLRYPIFYQHL